MRAPVLVCHRGASALAPENSLEAFRLAMQYGVDYSELDVHVGQSGEVLVSHDAPASLEEERVLPTLRQVFGLVRGRMGIYVELKGARTGAALGALLREMPEVPELIVGSAVLDCVAEIRVAAARIARSILFTAEWRGRLDDMIAACRAHETVYAHPCFRPIDAALVDGFHAAGLRVMTPHTNDAAEARYFAAIDVDVIASDDPRLVLPLRTLTSA